MGRNRVWLLLVALTAGSCTSSEREYQLEGQILAVDQARQEVTIKHGDIPRFMPAMTMTFKVRDGQLLTGRVPGDLVKGTLVVEDPADSSGVYLRTLERTGSAPLTDPPPSTSGSVIKPGDSVQDARLVDESGAPWSVEALRGQAIAITFTYTRCPLPNFCPLIDRHFKAAQDQVREDSELKARVRLASVTLDPEYDTPAMLSRHARALGADPETWHFVTGPPAETARFGSQFGVVGTREGTEVVHNLRTAVIDGQGRLTMVLNGGEWRPAELVAALKKAAGQ